MTPQELVWTFPNRYFYLASPYTKWRGGLDDAAYVIAEIAGRLIQCGTPVFSPIAHAHAICMAAKMECLDLDVWMPMQSVMVRAAAGLMVAEMDGWSDSVGVHQEIGWFRAQGKPCWLLDPVSLELTELPLIY